MTQDEAIVALAAVKLAIGAVTTETSETVPVDEIISQSPAAGTTVQARSRVAIVKSLGPA
jgi:beta-lactam-binding protein with PASTA domain